MLQKASQSQLDPANDHNEELYEKIINKHRNLLQTVTDRTLQLFGHICRTRISDERILKTLVFERMHENKKRMPTQRMHRQYRRVVRSKSALRSKPLSIGPKQLAEDGEAGIGRPVALSPWLMMMMMNHE